MNKEYLGYAARIDGEQFISPNGKRVWLDIGPLKNAIRYHATSLLRSAKEIIIYKAYESLEPHQEVDVIRGEENSYGWAPITLEVRK